MEHPGADALIGERAPLRRRGGRHTATMRP